jgi:hypothetical protein
MYVRFRYDLFVSVQEGVYYKPTWLISTGISSPERPMRAACCVLSQSSASSDLFTVVNLQSVASQAGGNVSAMLL